MSREIKFNSAKVGSTADRYPTPGRRRIVQPPMPLTGVAVIDRANLVAGIASTRAAARSLLREGERA